MISIYISSLAFYFPGNSPLISGPKMAENPKILSTMATQGVEDSIKLKVTNLKRGPDNSGDDYNIHLLSFALFFRHTARLSGLKSTENP